MSMLNNFKSVPGETVSERTNRAMAELVEKRKFQAKLHQLTKPGTIDLTEVEELNLDMYFAVWNNQIEDVGFLDEDQKALDVFEDGVFGVQVQFDVADKKVPISVFSELVEEKFHVGADNAENGIYKAQVKVLVK